MFDRHSLIGRARRLFAPSPPSPPNPVAAPPPRVWGTVSDFAAYLAGLYGCAQSGAFPVYVGPIEQFAPRAPLLDTLRASLEDAPAAVVAARPAQGRPPDAEMLAEFRGSLEGAGIEALFSGLASTRGPESGKDVLLAVVRKPRPAPVAPASFRVVAYVGAYNEEDVIEPFLDHTIAQGVEVCLLDNWSTDRTAARAARFLGRGLTAILKFPAAGPIATHEWRRMLVLKAELAGRSDADWFVHLDPDEIRESPWPGLTLREALYRVDQEGFNAVDHTCIVFHPTGGGFRPDLPLQPQFSHFEFGQRWALDVQVKAWKRQPAPVDCATSAGHDVQFPGRRVYPFKFLLRHYPIRSQEHGERKVFEERLPRFSPALRRDGWHNQYDGFAAGCSFVREPATLLPFDPAAFYDQYLVERLSGLGV